MTNDSAGDGRVVRDICGALERHGGDALDGAAPGEAARRWLAHGFSDAEEIADWLAARCFRPDRAQELERAGFTPEQAALRTAAGRGGYEDTVAFKVSRGDLTLEEARRVVTSDFWND